MIDLNINSQRIEQELKHLATISDAAILRKLQDASGKNGAFGFLSSHPSTAARIEQAEGVKSDNESDQLP